MLPTQKLETLLERRETFDFIAIDFETATYSSASACSIGIAAVQDGVLAASTHLLIQPPGNQYSQFNIDIHGIYPEETEFAPSFRELWPEIAPLFSKGPVLAHNAAFDMGVLLGSLGRDALSLSPNFPYLDTLQMVRNLVPGRRNLAACCAHFGIPLKNHHHAEADAVACAEIALSCLRRSGAQSLEDFCRLFPFVRMHRLHSLTLPKAKSSSSWGGKSYAGGVNLKDIVPTCTEFNPQHPLYQKAIVFTGTLQMSRREAMQQAVNQGALLRSSVSSKTDYLVLGRPDYAAVGASGISSKEQRGRELLASGRSKLQLLNEDQFLALLAGEPPPSR